MKPTPAQRKVLELLADGGVMESGYRCFYVGTRIVLDKMQAALSRMGWIHRYYSGEYRITDAGLEAIGR